jgi:hypothetical protein
VDEENRAKRAMVARVGSVLINLLLLAFIIGGSIIVAKQINWQELINQFKGKPAGKVKVEKNELRSRSVQGGSRSVEKGVEVALPAETKNSERSSRPPGIESVRALSQKIEELPTLEESTKNSPVSTTHPATESAKEPAKDQDVNSSPLAVTARPGQIPRPNPALAAEQIDAKQSGEEGFVTINSYISARIYVDGQFSGATPRTVKLTPGDHQIRLIADGYDDWTRRVRLRSKQQIGLMASMKKRPGQ